MDDVSISSALERGLMEAIDRVRPKVRPPVSLVSLEIYPWHSYVALSILDGHTSADLEGHPAEWHLFECASSNEGVGGEVIGAWGTVADAMNERWSAGVASDAGATAITDHLHRLAARVLTSEAVSDALRSAGWEGSRRQVVNVDDPLQRNFAEEPYP